METTSLLLLTGTVVPITYVNQGVPGVHVPLSDYGLSTWYVVVPHPVPWLLSSVELLCPTQDPVILRSY